METQRPIIITLPDFVEGEVETICALLRAGAGYIHLRKPAATPAQMEALLAGLREAGVDMERLTLHGAVEMARRYGVGGVHLPRPMWLADEAQKVCTAGEKGIRVLRRSCSTHNWNEVEALSNRVDYLFLSPLFDSISKQGYGANIDPYTAQMRLRERCVSAREGGNRADDRADGGADGGAAQFARVVALGGVAPDNVAAALRWGFDGVAVLGALWVIDSSALDGASDGVLRLDTSATLTRFHRLNRRMKAAQGRLQLISNGDLDIARRFLQGGGRWVQLRVKEAPQAEIIARGVALRELCHAHGAHLIINDDPRLVAPIGADGVHLGMSDMPVSEARSLLGEAAIIGSTTNAFGHIEALAAAPIEAAPDYVGLGPLRYTTTKKNLAPLLGLAGYADILSRMYTAGIHTPLVAIGGIEVTDMADLRQVGVRGIALSGAIARAPNPEQTTHQFLQALKENE